MKVDVSIAEELEPAAEGPGAQEPGAEEPEPTQAERAPEAVCVFSVYFSITAHSTLC